MRAMIGFKPYKPWQDVNLPRLSRGLLISLIFHVIFVLWLAETPRARLETQYGSAQSVYITLNTPRQTSAPALRPEAKASGKPPSPDDSGIPPEEDAIPTAFPAPTAPDLTYVAPGDVEEMAFVVDIEELPLPNGEQTPSGALYLKILISESGSADRIDILTSTLPEDYAATLVNSFYQARFSPARTAGLPVRSWRIIEIRFGDAEPVSG